MRYFCWAALCHFIVNMLHLVDPQLDHEFEILVGVRINGIKMSRLNGLMKLMVTCMAWGSLRIPCQAHEGEARPKGLKAESFNSLRAR